MATCNNCGSVIPDGAAFCPVCGQAFAAPTPEPTYEQPTYEQPTYEQPAYEQPVYTPPQPAEQPPFGAAPVDQPPYGQPPQYNQVPPQFNPQQPYQQPMYQQPTGPMPNAGLHLVFVIIGFLCGILWGVLALIPYNKMKNAISIGDSNEANAQAKKVRIFFIIGLVVNVLIVIGSVAGNM